jgi:hypothetical protein
VPASGLWANQRHVVFLGILWGDEILCEFIGQRKHFSRIPVVQAKNGCPALRLYPHAGKRELSFLLSIVDRLRIIKQNQ